jgi:ER-bound oxygenase mpaB/B'/Rubber oxygenase, catalytic domain
MSQITTTTALWDEVRAQATAIPEIYGKIDFSAMPERFTADMSDASSLRGPFVDRRQALLANHDRVDLIKVYTMMGDRVADAYAALLPKYGFSKLVQMLKTSCEKGLEAVPEAPPQLRAFLADMERKPDWLNLDLVNEGAKIERNQYANLAPYLVRGGLLATFMNKYSALPMALTGNFSGTLAAKRIFETATFFTLTAMPGALDRYGEAFKAAAMVRLMHSMVRFNVSGHAGMWDSRVYGVPIPQIDQMPAGMLAPFLLSIEALGKGRKQFTPEERARVELSRYRCFLLGLPGGLLGTTPEEIAGLMLTRHATLRKEFDDATCGALVRGAMAAELSNDNSLGGRISRRLEMSFSKAFFVRNFTDGDPAKAAKIGVPFTAADRFFAAAAALIIFPKMFAYHAASRISFLSDWADRRLIQKIKHLLRSYGHADFVSDGAKYKPAHA